MKKLIITLFVFLIVLNIVNAHPIILNYGVSKEKINQTFSLIDEDLTDLQSITFIYSNPKYRVYDGFYTPYNIEIYEWNDKTSNQMAYILLHELKHHYCWKKEFYLEHYGCFLNTPIDKKYGKIK